MLSRRIFSCVDELVVWRGGAMCFHYFCIFLVFFRCFYSIYTRNAEIASPTTQIECR